MDTRIAKAQNGLKALDSYGTFPMSTKFGEDSKSHHIIKTPEGEFMRSYSTIVAFISNEGEVVLTPGYDSFSRTTNFYRCQFLGERVNETRKKVKSGEYLETELN